MPLQRARADVLRLRLRHRAGPRGSDRHGRRRQRADGRINPKYISVKAIADIRPFNQWRAFFGDYTSNEARKARPGLISVYGWKSEAEAKKSVKVYGAYAELLAHAKEDRIEAIVIALPLHLHAPVAVAAMRAGLHVLTEKLMGHTVHECKEMARVAQATNLSWPPATNATTTFFTTTRWR